MRARIAEKLAWLGVALDPAANAAGKPLISRPDSRVALYVIPTDEELMIARHTLALLGQRRAKDDQRKGCGVMMTLRAVGGRTSERRRMCNQNGEIEMLKTNLLRPYDRTVRDAAAALADAASAQTQPRS